MAKYGEKILVFSGVLVIMATVYTSTRGNWYNRSLITLRRYIYITSAGCWLWSSPAQVLGVDHHHASASLGIAVHTSPYQPKISQRLKMPHFCICYHAKLGMTHHTFAYSNMPQQIIVEVTGCINHVLVLTGDSRYNCAPTTWLNQRTYIAAKPQEEQLPMLSSVTQN